VLRASSAPRASDACVVFPDCRRECVKFDHRRSFAGKRSAGNPLVHRQKGTSPNDVAALERILNDNHFDFATADSNQFNQLSESQFAAHRLLIVPGGNFEDIGNGLTATTASNIRKAVRGGLNYLGICAGAFFAGSSPYNGLNLTEGVSFKFYALENRNIRKAAVRIEIAGSVTLDHYWEDGPQLTGWGDVVAKYPDGTPAIVQGTTGDGWVVLSGVHPGAGWLAQRTDFQHTSAGRQCLCSDPHWRCAAPDAARSLLKTLTLAEWTNDRAATG